MTSGRPHGFSAREWHESDQPRATSSPFAEGSLIDQIGAGTVARPSLQRPAVPARPAPDLLANGCRIASVAGIAAGDDRGRHRRIALRRLPDHSAVDRGPAIGAGHAYNKLVCAQTQQLLRVGQSGAPGRSRPRFPMGAFGGPNPGVQSLDHHGPDLGLGALESHRLSLGAPAGGAVTIDRREQLGHSLAGCGRGDQHFRTLGRGQAGTGMRRVAEHRAELPGDALGAGLIALGHDDHVCHLE